METVYKTLIDRAERGMGDLLLTIYDHAYCAGANVPSAAPADRNLADLLSTLAGRYRAEILAARGWLGLEPPTADELPGLLLSLPQQADSPQRLAAVERQRALGDARPMEGCDD